MATDERTDSSGARSRRLSTGSLFLYCFAIGLVLTCAYVFLLEPYLEVRFNDHGPPVDPATLSTPFSWPGLVRPKTISAAEAKLDDADQVIGIQVDGQSRAYHVKSLGSTMRHVINDLISDVPVTVTYCDKTDCTRAFTSPQRGQPLKLGVGGLLSGKLLVREDNFFYWQETGKALAPDQPDLPYAAYPYEVTTWKAWREAHPETDVYVYEQPKPLPSDGPVDPFPYLPETHPRNKKR